MLRGSSTYLSRGEVTLKLTLKYDDDVDAHDDARYDDNHDQNDDTSGRIDAPPVNLAARCEKPLDRCREQLPPTCRVRRRAIIPLSGALPEIYDSGDEISFRLR